MKPVVSVLSAFAILAISFNVLAAGEPPQVHFVVKGFDVIGENPLSADETHKILEPFTGDHYGLERLQDAVVELDKSFASHGDAFYRAILIPQELNAGIIKLKIEILRLDKVQINGNQYFDSDNILMNLPGLRVGESPETLELSRALNLANTHPSKDIKLKLSESAQGGAIDASVNVVDRDPDFFFFTLNNTGTDETGHFRLSAGYQFSNLFNRDHSLALSYTTSPDDTSAVSQFGAFYSVPFYDSGSRLSILYARSDVDSGIIQQSYAIAGKGTATALRYNKMFLQAGAYRQEIEIGLDYKKFENDSTIAGLPQATLGSDVASRPVSLSYKVTHLGIKSVTSFNIGMAKNISGGSLNEDSDYLANGADTADWSTILYGAEYTHFFNADWLFHIRLNGQQTSDELIAGEQFGVGGMNSVRGYDERIILGDSGYQSSFEVWMPALSKYEIRPLVFYDIGHAETNNPGFGQVANEDPASAGAGIRWTSKKEFSASLDLAYVTKAAGNVEKGDNRAHLNIFYRF